MLPRLLPLLLAATTAATPHFRVPPEQFPIDQLEHPLSNTNTAPSESQPFPVGVHDGFGGWPPLPNVCTTPSARVYKRSSDPHPLSTLLTFRFPTTQFKYCWLEFNAPSGVTGSGKVQVFTTSQALSQCPTSDTSSHRDQYLGTWVIPGGGGNVSWVDLAGEYLNRPLRSRCPTATNPGGIQGIEIVGAGDDFDLRWTQVGRGGVRLLWTN